MVPTTYTTALLIAIFAALCWGSWPTTMKLGGKWRFELYYYDFSIGVLLVSLVSAFSFGMFADITFADNLTIVRRLQLGYAMLAGGVFNLGNMLLAGAATVSGITVAFLIGLGVASIMTAILNYYLAPVSGLALTITGCIAIAIAVVATGITYARLRNMRYKEQVRASTAAGKRTPPVKKTATKGILIAAVSGILLGSFQPLADTARRGDLEMGPYPIAVMFSLGIFATTLLYNLYFLNLPVQGDAISMFAWFRGSLKQHLLGVAGGVIWGAGWIALLAAAAAPSESRFSPALSQAIGHGAPLVAAFWGILYWKEFGESSRLKFMIWAAVGTFAIGVALLCLAPLSVVQ